tara:strand:- start:467 stop:880 length:414 start_codon:yes stop_codon:yes gene_type:complete
MTIEKMCEKKSMRMTDQRRVIARILDNADDHPDVEELHKRACLIDDNISVATVYRTVRLFEEAGILVRHEFKDGRSRYENVDISEHHDHLIDIETGEIIEFTNEEIELIQEKIADSLGFELVDHRLELYGRPKNTKK